MSMNDALNDTKTLVTELSAIGIALSSQTKHTQLLEIILQKTIEITNADGGTLYSCDEGNELNFEIMHNLSLGIHKGGNNHEKIDFPPIQLYDEEGNENRNMVAAWAAISGKTINIADAYTEEGFDFSGARNFDKKTGYRSVSFLTVPMVNHENEIIGVLQLINAKEPKTGSIIPFTKTSQYIVESLASQAAVTITNHSLLHAQKKLFNALIKLIAKAVDQKSPYTAGHCNRVPIITKLLADAACCTQRGPLKDFMMTDAEKYELEVAAWLHDCGKITTPEYVIDKRTKLETIFDRIKLIDTRFEILKRDAVIATLRKKLEQLDQKIDIDNILQKDDSLQTRFSQLRRYKQSIAKYNIGGEELDDKAVDVIDEIAAETWENCNETQPLLNDDEVKNLKITRGTLNEEERQIINHHVTATIEMLQSLPYPKHLRQVPNIAGGHHERMDGKGYPRGLTREEMSIPARILAIADIFEALTASDRPYKKAMPLSRALMILEKLKKEEHIDSDLYEIFMGDKIYLEYAKNHLKPEQLDV